MKVLEFKLKRRAREDSKLRYIYCEWKPLLICDVWYYMCDDVDLLWFIVYELWICDDDMIMKVPHMNMRVIWDWILLWYMKNEFDSIWDIVNDMMLHVRHIAIGMLWLNDMIWCWYLNTIVYDCAHVSHGLKGMVMVCYPSTCNMIYVLLYKNGPKCFTE